MLIKIRSPWRNKQQKGYKRRMTVVAVSSFEYWSKRVYNLPEKLVATENLYTIININHIIRPGKDLNCGRALFNFWPSCGRQEKRKKKIPEMEPSKLNWMSKLRSPQINTSTIKNVIIFLRSSTLLLPSMHMSSVRVYQLHEALKFLNL